MTWPTSAINTTNIDASGDSPATARADLKSAVDAVNAMIGAGDPFAQHGRYLGPQVFNSSGSYTPNASMSFVVVEVQGAGGGSAVANSTAGNAQGASGGGGGAYLKVLLTLAQVTTLLSSGSVPVTVGAGGTAITTGSGGNGGNGGDSRFGASALLAGGGGGSQVNSASPSTLGANFLFGSAGAASAPLGTVIESINGTEGGVSWWTSGTFGIPGQGGRSKLSIGGKVSPPMAGHAAYGVATTGEGYGGGGGGAIYTGSGGYYGQQGLPGLVIVHEYA